MTNLANAIRLEAGFQIWARQIEDRANQRHVDREAARKFFGLTRRYYVKHVVEA
jgi:hypothetical protein